MELFLLNSLEVASIIVFTAYVFFAVVPTQLFTRRTHAKVANTVICIMCVITIITGVFYWEGERLSKLSETEYFEKRLLDAGEYFIYDTLSNEVYTMPSELPEYPFDITVSTGTQVVTKTIESEEDLPVTWADIWQAYAMYEEGLIDGTNIGVLTAGTILPITKGIDTQTFTLYSPSTGICNGIYAIAIDNQDFTLTIEDLWREQLLRNFVLLGIILAMSSTKAIKFLKEKRRMR